MYEINKRVKEGKPTMDQRHISTKAFVGNITAEMGNDQRATVRKQAQAHGVMTNMVAPFYKRI
jgi:hypothetical protein